ncbi:MAG: LysR family transcriptional regulator [Dermatophilaceae bacterium]|nr:LysR family transcriptional regulator [Dermatophilaceae bacterium]
MRCALIRVVGACALVGAHGSLAEAAAELGLTPAAVTGQVAQAERQWGVPLVVRASRGARLTDAGEALAAHGREIDAGLRRAHRPLGGRAAVRGRRSPVLTTGTRTPWRRDMADPPPPRVR